ncbi:uncharacterized protein IWZ02DRAFT_456559 [Phyllosticta citriasiana]|uniref:uncharacterized protein n=1 Tax=Phyllosticta citriasiana TaxID=595635 RepID=UPI0030FD9FCA
MWAFQPWSRRNWVTALTLYTLSLYSWAVTLTHQLHQMALQILTDTCLKTGYFDVRTNFSPWNYSYTQLPTHIFSFLEQLKTFNDPIH